MKRQKFCQNYNVFSIFIIFISLVFVLQKSPDHNFGFELTHFMAKSA